MQKYLIYLSFEDENFYTYIEAESSYLAVAKAIEQKPNKKSVQKVTVFKKKENGDYQILDN